MTHAERHASMQVMLKNFAEKAKNDKAFAMQTFVAAGIYTIEGELTPAYGGPKKKVNQKVKTKA